MTTGTLTAMLDVARRNLGFIEGPRNLNPFAPYVGHANNQAWCASFVAAVAKRAGVTLPSNSAYTPAMADGFKSAGQWGRTPRVGAIVFFKWPLLGRIAHVGIVEKVNPDGSIVSIEGNTNGGGSRTGGRVMRQSRQSNIAGYGYPRYRAAAAPKPIPRPLPVGVVRPTVQFGDGTALRPNTNVALLQRRLNITADGVFGTGTKAKVIAYQKSKGLVADGVVGPKTWATFGLA